MNETNDADLQRGKAALSRRSLLIGGAGATAAGVAGLAAGIGVGRHAVPPAPGAMSARQRFAGKVVVITGATSGIGRAAAIAFAREGAKVAFCGRREALGHEVEQEIRGKGGTACYLRADVRIEAEVRRFIDEAVS
jgi:hypothetical protein